VDVNNLFDQTSFIQLDFDIGKTFKFQVPAVNFDLGIPALGIQANFQPEVTINFNLHVGFGVDTKLGFYFVTNKHEAPWPITCSLAPSRSSGPPSCKCSLPMPAIRWFRRRN
jgi:hypothetical protein